MTYNVDPITASNFNSLYLTTTGTTLTTTPNIMTQQNHVAVFLVERNNDNKIIKSKFLKDVWVETKPGASLDYAVAKEIGTLDQPENIIFKVIQTFTF